MMTDAVEVHRKEKKAAKVGASAAGAGSGTLLIAIANSLPEGHSLTPWLLYAAPTVTAALSIVWLWCQAAIGNYMQERKLATLIHKAKCTCEDALNNPNTSDIHKESMRKQLEELELIVSQRQLKQIKSMAPLKISDVQAVHQSLERE